MAERPVFVSNEKGSALVREVPIEFKWHSGMSKTQKARNVEALHGAARDRGIFPVLEVSTASSDATGNQLSAINLSIGFEPNRFVFESAYQGSKVFSRGGPYTDIYLLDGRSAKRDDRIRSSGRIVGFEFMGEEYPADPPTAFYDWLYINAVYSNPRLLEKISNYAGYTDISFNPERSLNCQARSCALVQALKNRGTLDDAVESFGNFLQILSRSSYGSRHLPSAVFG